ncbi:MAG: thioredoxin family protein [Desulfobacteraceae bacterium]|nr:MAG: thioredoxin family protein [Desulfobacteraceae bacterium]
MKIQILGLGCPKFKSLVENARLAAGELSLECEIEEITDIIEIMRFRSALQIPALAIDGQVKMARKAATVEEIKTLLLHFKKEGLISNAVENSAIQKDGKEQ